MATSNIPGVNADAISFVQKALLPDKSKAEAAAVFSRMIEDSLRSWFTQFNFFLHNLAQLRFHGDHNDDRLLSFVPKTFTLATDGRIIEVVLDARCTIFFFKFWYCCPSNNHRAFPPINLITGASGRLSKAL